MKGAQQVAKAPPPHGQGVSVSLMGRTIQQPPGRLESPRGVGYDGAVRPLARIRPLVDAWVRVIAAFGLLNLALGAVHGALDANWLWLGLAADGDLGPLVVSAFALAVLGWPYWRGRRSAAIAARVVIGAVAVACLVDAVGYFRVLSVGAIRTAFPVPLSLLSGLAMGLWAWRPPPPAEQRVVARLVVHGVAGALWIGGLVGSVAVTDYARPADAIVVFGAAVWPDGRPSDALRDRTRTALALYEKGLASTLVFSGGHGAGAPISEPAAMRRMAIEAGVDPAHIVLDETGANTAATVAAVAAMARARGWGPVLMVSHDYHCARIKLACVRQGLRAYTVPAVEPLPLAGKPYYIARELAAMAWYWMHPLKTVRRVAADGRGS